MKAPAAPKTPEKTTEGSAAAGVAAGSFKYDVAFSFLSQDEALAGQLNDRLQDRAKTFIYFERQKEIAGTDGEETFGRVFREEARLVVVLYRVGWGETKWTRIEQTAIRARGYEHGYDFAKFIQLEEWAKLPSWLPPTQIYIGLKRFGLDGAAAVIEQRIRELGGKVHQETVEEHAQRVEREIAFDKRRAAFQREPGVQAADKEFGELKGALERRAADVKNSTSIALQVGQVGPRSDGVWLVGLGRALYLSWKRKYFNTLEDARLEVVLFSHLPPQWVFEQPKQVQSLRFVFDLLLGDVAGWVSTDSRKRSFSTEDLADHLVRYYLEHGRAS